MRTSPNGNELIWGRRASRLDKDSRVSRVGIDVPFGWPEPFVNALAQHHSSGTWPPEPDDYEAQRALVLRSTDRAVRDGLGPQPLSVSTDRIAFAAMRCARLLSALASAGHPVDRTGSGKIIEVYPAAALRSWDISPSNDADDPGGFKGKARPPPLVEPLSSHGSSTRRAEDIPTDLADQCRGDDDKLDAFVCALIARAADTNCAQPAPAAVDIAEQKGGSCSPTKRPSTRRSPDNAECAEALPQPRDRSPRARAPTTQLVAFEVPS